MVKPTVASKVKPKKPRPRKPARELLYYSVAEDQLEESLKQHLHSIVCQSARFDKISGKYMFTSSTGIKYKCGGLTRMLKRHFYAGYRESRSRTHGIRLVKASSKRQGKTIHAQIARSLEKKVTKPNPLTKAVLAYLKGIGHKMQAAEVPTELVGWKKLTQADLITKDIWGNLFVWEVKTGMPISLTRPQGHFNGLPHVPATKLNTWHLQLAFTRRALELAGVKIKESRILHVYDHKKNGIKVEQYVPPDWAKTVAIKK